MVIKVCIIGGTGLEKMDIMTNTTLLKFNTPYGEPSCSFIQGNVDGITVVIVSRHGENHQFSPSDINYRANIWGVKELKCDVIIASAACGSLQEAIAPGHMVVVDDFIDRTTKRQQTFYDGKENHSEGVCHIPMYPAFNEKLRKLLIQSCEELEMPVHKSGTIVCIEGPRFSSRSESLLYRQWGGDVINMTVVPEVVLAKELGIPYAVLALVTDYDCWREAESHVSVEMKYNGKQGSEFLGIPFAKPPIKKLRFRPPQPYETSKYGKTFKAFKQANSCAAEIYESNFTGYSFWNPTNEISEDCLQLNMWVPKKTHPKGSCVLIYIYGGAFFSGSASLDVYNGSILAITSRCIVVNLNYRLGALGFAHLIGKGEIPGNMGLLDQQMGMKWVYNNIKYFGGNNKLITIFGESAGSVSVTSHLYAKGSFPYFNGIIANSGTIHNVWGRFSSKKMHSNTIAFAQRLDCYNETFKDPQKILECLQEVNIYELNKAGAEVQANASYVFEFCFSPIEYDLLFFKGNVSEKIKKNDMKKDVYIFIGKASDEFTYFMPYYFYEEKYNCSYDESLPSKHDKNKCNINENNYKKMVDKVSKDLKFPKGLTDLWKKKYLSKSKFESYRYLASRFLAEVYFDCDIYDWIKKINPIIKKKIYFYEFRVVSSANPWPKWMGAMHGYELEFEFGLPYRNPRLYQKKSLILEKKFSTYFMNLMGRFAEKGNPDNKWKPFTIKNSTSNILKLQQSYDTISYNKGIYTETCKLLQPYLSRIMG
uniref:S-methyl-5'-thioadenosine phosphorylase n=1 Tax=Parastrongyloides trichosuri TaxID=131310 RepID=A0A0N4ZX46_PARTI